jgi:hypothetical protein
MNAREHQVGQRLVSGHRARAQRDHGRDHQRALPGAAAPQGRRQRPRPGQRERQDDQPAGEVAQPPAAPEDAHLGRRDDVACPQSEQRDARADRRAGDDGDEHSADLLEAVQRDPRADEPPQDDHRHERPGHVASSLRERAPRRHPELNDIRKQTAEISEQDCGPPAQPPEIQDRDPQAGARPERARRTREQQSLTALRKGVIASSNHHHRGDVPHRPCARQRPPPGGRSYRGERRVGARGTSFATTVPSPAIRVERSTRTRASHRRRPPSRCARRLSKRDHIAAPSGPIGAVPPRKASPRGAAVFQRIRASPPAHRELTQRTEAVAQTCATASTSCASRRPR